METIKCDTEHSNNDFTQHVPDRIHSIKNIFTPDECNYLIQIAENAGFNPSPPSGGGHGQTPRTGARTSQFYVKDDTEIANKIWDRLKSYVPKNLRSIKEVPYMNSVTKGDEYKPIGVNDHIRFYKYDPGQFILKHDDYRMSRFRYDKNEDQYYEQMSFLTIVIYLNEDFSDGCTKFWTKYSQEGVKSHCRFIRDIEFTEADLTITPETGKAVIHDHMVQHEGESPRKSTKYILRTDILHEKVVSESKVDEKFKKGQVYGGWHRHYEPSCLNYTE
jgi:hypothetical protein